MPLVVCDAGPLIHLDELGCVDLLSDFSEVLVPETVWRVMRLNGGVDLNHRVKASGKGRQPVAYGAHHSRHGSSEAGGKESPCPIVDADSLGR